MPTLTAGRLTTIVASRFVINAIFRIAYPLIPLIAERFNVTPEQATWIVTIQVLMGLCSPLGGWLGDRIGYRLTMLLGTAAVWLGVTGIAFAPSLALIVACYGLCGFGVALYHPATHAYISIITPYHQRGRAVGLAELSWALAGIAAIPPLMWLIQGQNTLSGAFVILSAMLALAIVAMIVILPEARSVLHAPSRHGAPSPTILTPSVIGLLAFAFLVMGGNELFFIVQSTYARTYFNATLADLGTASLVFGLGELCGSSGSALLTDRIGKRRAVALGFSLAAMVYATLPLFGTAWLPYLAGYFFFALFAEFAIVALLTFASTVTLVRRGTVMALTTTAFQVSRAFGSQAGIALFERTSFVANGLIAALLVVCGVVIALRFVHDNEQGTLQEAAQTPVT